MNFTRAQQEAIAARGDTLVIAGAGTGKTRTLVERCIQWLLHPAEQAHLDELLVVTFTEAAAAEIRHRIRRQLEDQLAEHPEDGRLHGHAAGLDTAHIGTLHSFCLKLIRQHFHELEIDPQVTVLAEEQTALLAEQTLDALFERHYAGEDPVANAVKQWLRDYADGWDQRARSLILSLHHFTQTRLDPEGWFERQLERCGREDPEAWRRWFFEAIEPWRRSWLPVLAAMPSDHAKAARCRQILEEAPALDLGPHTLAQPKSRHALYGHVARMLGAILEEDQEWPYGTKTKQRPALEDLFKEAAYLLGLCPDSEDHEPLAEDWQLSRPAMATLLNLARDYGRLFSQTKRERGAVDFHDLEQFCLRLLWDTSSNQPTPLAQAWRARIRLVLVDEYQDINEAQDTILRALSRDGSEANRFLVGDVKQSIYRFRQADPRIFRNYAALWSSQDGRGTSVFLSDNFRSREDLLEFVNPLFAGLMRESVGGVAYDDQAALRFGDPTGRAALRVSRDSEPRVSLHLRVRDGSAQNRDAQRVDETGGIDEWAKEEAEEPITNTELEARLVATELKRLREAGHQIWDPRTQTTRPVEWPDMVVLLRSPSLKVESYAKEFGRLGVPLVAKRSGFFESIEVSDLLNVLALLDNPVQDIPLVAVLRSPLAGLTLNELAQVRLAQRKGRFWHALRAWHQGHVTAEPRNGLAPEGLCRKVPLFIERLERWRTHGRHLSLTQRLEMILEETSYRDWLLSQPRGEQRHANIHRLLSLAREFDDLHAQGLHRFLRMLEAQQDAAGDREPASDGAAQAVQLMSIHQSKGLEFPVVAVADLGKRFNLSDTREGILLDEHYGLCPRVRLPATRRQFRSLPFWLAERRQKAEALGEELRILYVALTRAQDSLLLFGTASAKAAHETWSARAGAHPPDRQFLKAGSYLDWLGPWFTHHAREAGIADWSGQTRGRTKLWSWQLHELDDPPADPAWSAPTLELGHEAIEPSLAPDTRRELEHRVTWRYPFQSATRAAAKSSVSILRRAMTAEDDEAKPATYLSTVGFASPRRRGGQLSASDVGLAHHRFLQWADLAHLTSEDALRAEATHLANRGLLSPTEVEALDLGALTRFWGSEVGTAIRHHADRVRREWRFTCRFNAEDWPRLGQVPREEFVVVQGVADLLVRLPEEMWLLDFKTDHFPSSEYAIKVEQYRPQLALYQRALEKIYGKPVTQVWLHFLSTSTTHRLFPDDPSGRPAPLPLLSGTGAVPK